LKSAADVNAQEFDHDEISESQENASISQEELKEEDDESVYKTA